MENKNFSTAVQVGIGIFIVNVLAFFAVYYFGFNEEYYRTTMKMNSFFLPFVFVLGAYISIMQLKKRQKLLGFREVFRAAFYPMLIGGFLTFIFAFIFLNHVDTAARDVLNVQYVESFKSALNEDYQTAKKVLKPGSKDLQELEAKYKEAQIRLKAKDPSENMFSFRYFSIIFAGYLLFFALLALILGTFFRNKPRV